MSSLNQNSSKHTFQRTLSREYAFKFLYHLQFSQTSELQEKIAAAEDVYAVIKEPLDIFDQSFREEDTEHPDNAINEKGCQFATELIVGVLTHNKEIQKRIETYLDKPDITKIKKINLCLLLLGSYELIYLDDIPPRVTIDETIKIAKKFGEKESYAFVNAILDNLSKEIKKRD